MPRARNIKPAFFKNEFLAELPAEARLLFIGLWTLADREGRLEDRPKRIKMEIFPCDNFDMDDLLSQLNKAAFIIRYKADNINYIQITNFIKHQMPHHKEIASIIPAPDGHKQITRHSYEVSTQTRKIVFDRDNNSCLKCKIKDGLSIDHIKPLAKGGDNSINNLQTLCAKCNSSKGDTTKDYRKGNDGSTLAQRCGNDGAFCPSDSFFLTPDSPSSESPLLNPETPLPKKKGLKMEFSGNYDIDKHLNDTGRASAKMSAPGWDMYELVKVYNQGIANGDRPPPNKPNIAFPAWCGKYTKGKQL